MIKFFNNYSDIEDNHYDVIVFDTAPVFFLNQDWPYIKIVKFSKYYGVRS